MSNSKRIPRLCKHRASGQAVVCLTGKDYYLGRYGTAAAQANYERLIGEWLVSGRRLPDAAAGMTVNELILAYDKRCEVYYRKPNGEPTSEVISIRQALRPLRELYGRTLACDFGPLALKAVRERMVQKGWCRSFTNKQIGRIKRMFRWAVENEFAPPSVFQGLLAVAGLKRGRCEAKETTPVRPVPEAWIDATRPFLPGPVRAVVELQLLTGMRPGEAVSMRGCDLEMSGRVWVYRPESHKTEHFGRERQIFIGPRAQEIVKPFLKLDTTAYLFSPAESEEARNRERSQKRKTPLWPSHEKHRNRMRKRTRQRPPGDRYDVAGYRRAIYRACEQAFPLPDHLDRRHLDDSKLEGKKDWQARLAPEERAQVKAWRRQHQWHPHRLRHNAGTNLRKEFGVELARIILGHATAFTTEIYAEADRQQAIEVIAKIG